MDKGVLPLLGHAPSGTCRKRATTDRFFPLGGKDHAASFWARVDRSGGPRACWPWQGERDKDGYGRFLIRVGERRRRIGAHRVAYLLTYGEHATESRHRCDFKPCCNPAHLLSGTHADNMRDMVERGLSPYGTRNAAAKLDDAKVLDIRRRHGAGERPSHLAHEYGVSPSAVNLAVKGRTWRHLPTVSP